MKVKFAATVFFTLEVDEDDHEGCETVGDAADELSTEIDALLNNSMEQDMGAETESTTILHNAEGVKWTDPDPTGDPKP